MSDADEGPFLRTPWESGTPEAIPDERPWPVWQCSGCRSVFASDYLETCPVCGRVGYWSGSVDPVALRASFAAAAADAEALRAEVERLRTERDAAVKLAAQLGELHRLDFGRLQARAEAAEARVAALTAAIKRVQYDWEHQQGDWRGRVVMTLHNAVAGGTDTP